MNSKINEASSRVCNTFDGLAHDYAGGSEDPVKGFLGGLKDFAFHKARWLDYYLKNESMGQISNSRSLLDFGCGTGEFLSAVRELKLDLTLAGCDLSVNMIREAQSRWKNGESPHFFSTQQDQIPRKQGDYDFVTASCVIHHVPVDVRAKVFSEFFRVLNPQGRLVIFEHNPANLITQWIVSRCKFDDDAVLVSPAEAKELMMKAGFKNVKIYFTLLTFPWFTLFDPIEHLLSGIPLGCQYMIVGEKGERL